ncbi:MAG: hypothetical protein HUJ60_01120 [Bacilli bacterium]|nr:hypothetical protein [Bacilli bacterium]
MDEIETNTLSASDYDALLAIAELSETHPDVNEALEEASLLLSDKRFE